MWESLKYFIETRLRGIRAKGSNNSSIKGALKKES